MDLEVIMLGSNTITMQYIIANQKIFNYGDLVYTNVEPREPTDDNADDTKCLATAQPRCEYNGTKEITYNRADVATRLTNHPVVASGSNPDYLTRDLAFRLGLFLDAGDLNGVDLSPVTEPTEITFAPTPTAFAVRGSIAVTKCIPCVVAREAGEWPEEQLGTNDNPFLVEAGKVYEIPFSRIPDLAKLEDHAYPYIGGELPGKSVGYIDHGFDTYQKDGKWWLRYYAPLIFNASTVGGTSPRTVQFSLTNPELQGNFTVKAMPSSTDTVPTSEGPCLRQGATSPVSPYQLARGESVIIPYELISQMESPELSLTGITCTVEGIVGAICVTHLTGGVAIGLPSDIYVKITNNIDGDAQSGNVQFTHMAGETNRGTTMLYFTFE